MALSFPSTFQNFLPIYSVSFLGFYAFPSYFFFKSFLPLFFQCFLSRFLSVFFLLFFLQKFSFLFSFQCFFLIFSVFSSYLFYRKFTSSCLNANYTNLDRLLKNYLSCEFEYREITEFRKVYHKKNISLSAMRKTF